MRSALIRTVRLISTALAVCLGALPAVPGAPPPHLAPEDLTAAVRFEEDRAAAQLIGTAEDALLRGDHTQAVAILQDVLDSDTAGLVHTSDGYRSALRQTWQLLRSSSPEVIDHYRRDSAGAARAELNAALAGDDDRHLLDVVLRYRFTDAGVSALETLAQRRLDSGRFPEAATLYEELIRGAPDAGQQARRNPAAVRAWILALHESGDDPAALAVAGEFASVIDATGRFGLLLTGLRASQPETSGDSTRKGRDISGWLPSARADWEFTFPADDSIPGDAGAELQEFAAASVAPFLQVRPLEVPDGLVIRTARGVVRLDPRTGQLAWRWTAAAGDSEARLPASGPLASRETRRMLERTFGDSVHTGLAADRERVYFLQQHTDSFGDEPSLSNSLIAVDVETGKELWAHGGGPDAGNLRGVFFRGAPTVYGGELLVVGERATSIELFVLDATNGDLNRSVKLCVPAASPVRDDRRLAQECRVLLAAGKAICPTGGGGLVAVDLISREVGWAYRYPREPVYEDDVSSRSQAQTPRQLVWADSWSAPQLCAAGGRIVLASGESDVLHVLNAHSGALLWTRPRQDELYVGCVTDTHVILVHPHRVSAVRLEDGAVDWSMAMAQPSGRGCVANGRYLLPLLGGGVAAIRLSDGELTRTYSASDSRPHVALDSDIATAAAWRPVTLVRTGDQVTEQSLSAVRRLVNLGEALDSAAEPAPDRERVESAIRHATRLREAGDFRAAADKLLARNGDGLDESERDRLRRFAVDTILTGNWLMNDAPQIGDVEEQLIGSEADRIRFEICRLRSALRDPSPAAIDSALRLVDLGAERYFLEREDGTGWVRLDRQVQAWLGQVLGDVDGPTRLLLDEALTEALQERDARSGDTEAHRVLSWLDHIPAARRLRVQLPPRWSTIGELIRYELELEQLATDDDSTLAAGALAALLKLYEAHSDYRQAARIFLRLQSLAGEDSPAGVIPEIPEDSPLKPYLEGPTLPAWPSREPDVTSAPGVNDDAIYFLHPQIVAECPALVDGLTVSIARNGDRLRFAGGSWSQEWDLELPLVRGPAELMRNDFFADLRRAWMFGNLLVLQVGGNVFGVAPLDRNGEASAELVWPQTAELISAGEGWAQICTHAQSDAPRPHGFAERRLLLDTNEP